MKYIAVMASPEINELILMDDDRENVIEAAKEYSEFNNSPAVICKVSDDFEPVEDENNELFKDIDCMVFGELEFTIKFDAFMGGFWPIEEKDETPREEEYLFPNEETEWFGNHYITGLPNQMIFGIGSWNENRKIENELLRKTWIHFVDKDFLEEHGIYNAWEFDPERRYYALNQNVLKAYLDRMSRNILLINELPDMTGENLEREEIELLNECLNRTWFRFPLFEGFGRENEIQNLVRRGVLELYHAKEKTYKATSFWRDYVRAVLKDW